MSDENDWTRRQFLGHATAAVAATSLAACDPDGPQDPYADAPTSVAAVGAQDDVEAAVRRAIELAGGLDMIEAGQTVFIKPNAVGTVPGALGFVTSHEVLAAVIRTVKDRDPGWIVVGDRSARLFESAIVFDETGMGATALAAGADEVYPAPRPSGAPDDYELLQPPFWEETWSEPGGVLAMKRVLEADHLINVPVAKNHRWAGHSLSMKNLMGCVGDEARDYMHYNQADPDRLSRDIVILNQLFPPTMTIIDTRTAIVNGGPEGMLSDGVVTEPGVILAGTDRIALDAYGVALLQDEIGRTPIPDPDARHDMLVSTFAWAMPQLLHAMELDIGLSRSHEDVRLAVEGLERAADIERRFREG